MASHESAIRDLGEIALRVDDLARAVVFYQEVIGLTLLRRFETSAFFTLAPGHRGHTRILALFDRSAADGYQAPEAARSSVDHIAFNIDLEDYEREQRRLESLGLEVTTTTHPWVGWRSIYVRDPEGTVVELVCFDPETLQQDATT